MVNNNLLSSPAATKKVRFRTDVDHVTKAVSSKNIIEQRKIVSESSLTAIDDDIDANLSREIEIPDKPVIFNTTNIHPHSLQVHSSLIPDSEVVLTDSRVLLDNNDYIDCDTDCDEVVSLCEDVASLCVDDDLKTCMSDSMVMSESTVSTEKYQVEEVEYTGAVSGTLESIVEESDGDIDAMDGSVASADAIDTTKDHLLGTRIDGRVWTVYPSAPIPSSSVTSVPLMHSVVIIPRSNKSKRYPKKKKSAKIHSVRQDLNKTNDDMEWRTAFPEPDPTASDHSVFVDVAIQALSVEEIDKDYPTISHTTYAATKRQYQIDGGASLTAISESKARQLKCKFIQRKEFQIVVSVANGEMMRSQFYTPLKVTFTGVDDSGQRLMKTVRIIANIVPSLSGDIIIGSDVMKALRITIPYNDENTATLRVAGETLIFKYNTTMRSSTPMIKKMIVVKKSAREPVSAEESFNSLFYGDRFNDEQIDSKKKRVKVRPIPQLLKAGVLKEYELAASDPKSYLQNFKLGEVATAAQLVALHRVFNEYDVEVTEGRSIMQKDGTTVQADVHILRTEIEDQIKKKSTTLDMELSSLMSPPNLDDDHNVRKYIQYQVHKMQEDIVPDEDDIVHAHKLTVINGEVVEDVAKISDNIDANQQQEELNETLKYIAVMRDKYYTSSMDDLRPVEFPADLWKYVADSQKVLVPDRWKSFKDKCSPPERLQEVIELIMKIDISVENPSRKAEEPYFRAQCLANLHIYAHPDPKDPPSVKGREYEINLNDTSPCTAAMRKTSLLEKAYLYWRTKQLESRKMIGVSTSAYNNPPLCVPYPAAIAAFIKKHGDNAAEAIWKEENANDIVKLYRLVNDFRDLNNKTKLERWPLPYILDLLDKMRGSGRYSTEDIEDAFFTVPMKKEHRHLTAFSTPHGHFEYLCMGQGLKNAANYFARIVHEMFYGLQIQGKCMSVYQDDVCNFSDDLFEHLLLQQEIYDIMASNTLVFKSVKGHLNYSTQRILGHIMSKEGRAPDPSLISTIQNLAKPTTLEAVRSCLGLAQVAREYVHNLADVIAPIQQLARKGVDIEKAWGPEQEASFAKLKEVITTAPVLVLPNVMKRFRVHVDACRVGRGIGAILLQLDEHILLTEKREVWRPVAYWSRSLSKEERRYSATELECTALHDSILHWRVYLQNGLPFETIVDHYALVYMVTKMSGSEGNLRLHNLCLGLQGYTFSVTHRKGELHMDADAVSRLFHKDEVAYVYKEEDLRDDMAPLTEKEKQMLTTKWGDEDSRMIQEIIERHKAEQRAEDVRDVTSGSSNDDLVLRELEKIDSLKSFEENVEQVEAPSYHIHHINRITADQQTEMEIPDEYVFCFYCDGDGVMPNMYLEGGKEANSNTKLEFPYLLRYNDQCLICLSIHVWVFGAPTYVVYNDQHRPFHPALTKEDKIHHLDKVHRWIQKIMNIKTLDKVSDMLAMFPTVSYSVYHQLSELLRIDYLSNHALRLAVSTQYLKLPKIVIDTMEFEFIVRRLAGRGYSKYFQSMDYDELIRLALDKNRLIKMIPHHIEMFEDRTYICNLLDMFIKIEIQNRQDMVYLEEGVTPTIYSHETSDERNQIFNFIHSIKCSNTDEYQVNLNDIRQSVRLREKKEVRRERELEELRVSEFELRQKKSKDRTQRYNKKIRRKLRRRSVVLDSAQPSDAEIDVVDVGREVYHDNDNSIAAKVDQPVENNPQRLQRRRRPKMIIVDKTERRPPSRLVGEEFKRNRFDELVHETLESYDYLVQEFIIDPDDETVCMVLNTYLADDQYMATLSSIDCEEQHELQSPEFRYRPLLGSDGVVNLVAQFHNMMTGNNSWPITNEQWMKVQEDDPSWGPILHKITVKGYCLVLKNKDDYVDYIMREDLEDGNLGPLIRRTNIPKKLTHSNRVISYVEEVRQMIVPSTCIMMCMEITHKALGHPGFHRMLQTVRKSYYWTSMMADIRMYCSNCHYCRARKSTSERGSIPIGGYYISERPWQRCHIDCMVGLPISDIGQFTAVLILKCALSKFICLEPLKDVTAQSISEALVSIFTHHGVPEYIISDNGVEFSNYLTTDVLKLLGTYKFHITPLNPRANGQAENQVKTVKDMLSMLVSKDQRDWSLYIRLVQMRYNSTVNQATGFTPYFMMNGREMPTPDHEHIQSTYDKNKNIEIEGYFGNLITAMMLIWEAVGEEILQKTEHYNKVIGTDVTTEIKSYEPGQYVFVRRIPRRFYKDQQENIKYHINFKLQPIRWTGPYRILERTSPVLYILDFHNTRKKIHIIHLKLASNTSISRRRLELIRLKQKGESKDSFQDNNKEDEHWQDHHSEENLD